MTTDIAIAQASALEAAQKMLGGLQRTVNDAPSGGGDYLRFGRDGEWTFGTENKTVDGDTDVALLNVLSVQAGFVCWSDYPKEQKKKNEKLGERMAPVTQPISVDSLPDHGWDWKPQQGAEFKFIEGAHVGKQTKFVTSSQGGLERFSVMISAVTERVAAGSPYFFPLVLFANDHYQHPAWGKTYKPLFDIVGWADVNGNEEPANGAASFAAIVKETPAAKVEPTPEPAPAPAPEPTPEPVAVAPVAVEPVAAEPASDEPTPRRRRR